MRVFTIAEGPHKGKHIHVTRYVKSKSDTGMEIKISHNVPTRRGRELQWVQTVTSNNEFTVDCKMQTRVDPFGHGGPVNIISLPSMPGICKADDLLPFYWTAKDLEDGAGPGFSDEPAVAAPAKGRIWSQFTTALTEVTGKTVHHLVAISWGYDVMADGSVREDAIRYANRSEMYRHGQALKKMYPGWRYN
jgi:hypothetical protein